MDREALEELKTIVASGCGGGCMGVACGITSDTGKTRFFCVNCDQRFYAALPKLIAEVEQYHETLDDVRDLLTKAAHHEDGVDDSDVQPAIVLIGELLGDDDDYRARQKCSDDPCELCGEGGQRNILTAGYAKYVGVCDECYALECEEQKRNCMPPALQSGGSNAK